MQKHSNLRIILLPTTAQVAGITSLRELEITVNSHPPSATIIYKTRELKRSTLSDANNTRSFAIFRDIATELISHLRSQKKNQRCCRRF
ncbi:MAG: hypothetical protein ACRCYZ_05400 [Alphaproteobacteria bacterium]